MKTKLSKAVSVALGYVDVLVGLQWGDEGKGKMIDYLSQFYDVVCRFNGGQNAGHTIIHGVLKFVLHILPSGILNPNVKNVIGNGVVFSPEGFVDEVNEIQEKAGIDIKPNLYISNRAHITIPTHRWLDKASEDSKGDSKIGSTLKGISPTYRDKISREGLRYGDIYLTNFKEMYQALKTEHLKMMESKYHFILSIEDMDELDIQEAKFFSAIESMKSFQICDTSKLLNDELHAGKKILAEGAQGTLLDIDHGSYKFVTSSNVISGAVCTGLGISPKRVRKIYGAAKAYNTRVGSGPFPTELFDDNGDLMRKNGCEFGATTGRPRRCGDLDLVLLKQQCIVNGVTDLIILKGDVLSGFNQLPVCKSYDLPDGTNVKWPPHDLYDAKPVYEQVPGWKQTMQELNVCKTIDDLPQEFINYLNQIVEYCNTDIAYISVGPDKEHTIEV